MDIVYVMSQYACYKCGERERESTQWLENGTVEDEAAGVRPRWMNFVHLGSVVGYIVPTHLVSFHFP